MTRRRSKRKATVMEGLTKAYGGLRRSKRTLALKADDRKIYGDDYGILPSGKQSWFRRRFDVSLLLLIFSFLQTKRLIQSSRKLNPRKGTSGIHLRLSYPNGRAIRREHVCKISSK